MNIISLGNKIHASAEYLNTLPYFSGGAICWGTALQAGASRVQFPTVSLEFFTDIILPAAVCPFGWLSL